MSNLFAGVYGAKFPEVVMNSGPLPPEGGLPAPLHDTPDARINYGSTLLGDLQPYAYGEAGYMSSQSQNNQPHRIQKIIPELHLPEPHGRETFKLSHAVDDSDLAFVMRLNRNSIFCTGTRGGTRRNTKVGTTVDPIINLPTLNYLLAGLQVARPERRDDTNLWWEFLHNLDPVYWSTKRNYDPELRDIRVSPAQYASWPQYLKDCFPDAVDEELMSFAHRPFTLDDVVHLIRHCAKPFGIVRGSEKQGGQHEMGLAPVTWTAPTIATLVIDGKEANVVNIWHYHPLHAGEDLVLRLKLMPVKTFTLNHYFKGFARKTFEVDNTCLAWQLVPDVFNLDSTPDEQLIPLKLKDPAEHAESLGDKFLDRICNGSYLSKSEQESRSLCLVSSKESHVRDKATHKASDQLTVVRNRLSMLSLFSSDFASLSWQQLGYWHIGRTQVARPKYGTCEFYNDDMANSLKTNHIDMTFQPYFGCLSRLPTFSGFAGMSGQSVAFTKIGKKAVADEQRQWTPQLGLEKFVTPRAGRMGKRLTFEPEPAAAGQPRSDADLEARPAKRAAFRVGTMAARPNKARHPAVGRQSRLRDIDWSAVVAKLNADLDAGTETGPEALQEAVAAAADVPAGLSLPGSDAGGLSLPGPDAGGLSLPGPDAGGPAMQAPADGSTTDSGISESSRQELLEGLAAPAGKKAGRVGGRARKTGEAAASRGPVDGTLLRPGAEPEPCRMELL